MVESEEKPKNIEPTTESTTESLIDKLAKTELKDEEQTKVTVENPDENKQSTGPQDRTNELIGVHTWEDLKVPKNIIDGLVEMNFIKPSKIQAISYELAISKYPNKHLIAQSQNGSGKTGGFSIPLLSKIDESLNEVQGVVLCHNREMTNQVVKIMRSIAKNTKINVQEILKDKDAKKGHVIVTNAAMFSKYFLDQKKFSLNHITTFVVDEADYHINTDISKSVIEKFFTSLKNCTNKVQLLLFSATFEKDHYKFVNNFFKGKFISIKVEKSDLTLKNVQQFYIRCNDSEERSKDTMIEEYLKANMENERVIIFTNKRENTINLCQRLRKKGYKVFLLMGGDMDPKNRDETVTKFNEGSIQILVTTDLLSRGFDEKLVKLIINYDIPITKVDGQLVVAMDTYLHRIGRTGRFNTKGIGLSLVNDRFMSNISEIEEFYKSKIEEIKSMDDLIDKFKKLLNEY
jgi:ATP-dependent RNA helicase DDX19/DBP5